MVESQLDPLDREVVLTILEGLSCPRAVSIAILLRYDEWDQLVSMKADPLWYNTPEEYWAAAQATDLLRKCPDLPLPSHLRRRKARETFWASERQCCITNVRLDPLLHGPSDGTYDAALHTFFVRVRKIIKSWIGEGPRTPWEGKFGPGATVSDSSRRCTIADKLSSVPTFTDCSRVILPHFARSWWGRVCARERRGLKSARGNTFFCVPKDATTDRGCAKEPSVNAYYQRGLGEELQSHLARIGLNLKSGTFPLRGKELHMAFAAYASQTGKFATIDLSSASDTLCIALVRLLLPTAWFQALWALRSPFTRVDGKWVRLEKFSSMGNGFTFELETLLFAAISQACSPESIPGRDLLVFGDDIIVKTEAASDVLAALRFCGFTPNKRKTYVSGSFRESCGGDFFDGVGVRPHFIEEFPKEPQEWISMANGIRRSCHQRGASPARWEALRKAWFVILDRIPHHIRKLRGPQALGDIVIHDDESRWIHRWRDSQIREVRAYRPVSVPDVFWERYSYQVQEAVALYGIRGRDPKGHDHNLVSRLAKVSYSVGWVPYS